jgi:hypothetical protein
VSGLIKDMRQGGTIYVDVPNDKFDAISEELGGWSESNNQCCTSMDALQDQHDDGSEFAKEFFELLEEKGLGDADGDVIIQKENPK